MLKVTIEISTNLTATPIVQAKIIYDRMILNQKEVIDLSKAL